MRENMKAISDDERTSTVRILLELHIENKSTSLPEKEIRNMEDHCN